MRHAIFFAVPRDAEIEIRIAQLGGAADRAAMESFSRAARVGFKTSAPRRNVVPVPRLMNGLRSEADEVGNESGSQCCSIGICTRKQSEHQKRCVNPRQSSHCDRQNKKSVDNVV